MLMAGLCRPHGFALENAPAATRRMKLKKSTLWFAKAAALSAAAFLLGVLCARLRQYQQQSPNTSRLGVQIFDCCTRALKREQRSAEKRDKGNWRFLALIKDPSRS
jgi:hypothetical protein